MAIQKILTDLEVSGAVTIDSATDTILKLNSTDNGALYVNYARSDDRHAYVGFGGASDNFTIMSEEVGGQLILGTAATTRMTIDETGNVGIGTVSPDAKLHVWASNSGVATPTGTLVVEKGSAPSIQILSANTQTQSINFGDPEDGDVGRITYSHATDEMTLVTAATARVTIDSVGHVGINETNPSEELHVTGRAIITDRLGIGGDFVPQKALHLKNAAPIFRMEDTDTASYAELVKSSSSFIFRLDPTGVEAGSDIGFQVDGTETMVVKDGHVEALKIGINQVSPVASVDIVETSLPTTGQSYGVLVDMEKDSSTTAYTVSAFGLRSYARSVNTGTNQITDVNGLWSKAEHTGTGPTYFLIGSTNRGVHNGSGNTGVVYGNFAEASIIGTGVGTHPYLVGGYSKTVLDNVNATVTNSVTHYIKTGLTAGSVTSVSGLLVDLDMSGGTVSGDVEYIQIKNDTIASTVTGDSRAINSLSVLPSTFVGDITIGSNALPETTLDVDGCVRIADDSTTATAKTAGAMRYREAGNFSYFDMVMRTLAGYEWVNVVRNDFNI